MGLPGCRAALTLAAAAAAGCYAPTPAAGVPCSEALTCPTGQFCDRSTPDAPTCLEAPPSANDQPSQAIDVSEGGRFDYDATGAHDDTDAPCGVSGGPDVFFRISLPEPEVVYLDTEGSSGIPAIAIRQGSCTSSSAAEACTAQTCGEVAQGAWRLPAGEHCIVVDHAELPGGPGRLTVIRGHRDGDPLTGRSGAVTGDTCNDDNSNDASCGCEPAKDHHYFFTVCPAATVTAHVDTCIGSAWDTVLQLRDGADNRLGCNDDGMCGDQSTMNRVLTGPGLFWVIVDGCFECGAYTLQYSY